MTAHRGTGKRTVMTRIILRQVTLSRRIGMIWLAIMTRHFKLLCLVTWADDTPLFHGLTSCHDPESSHDRWPCRGGVVFTSCHVHIPRYAMCDSVLQEYSATF